MRGVSCHLLVHNIDNAGVKQGLLGNEGTTGLVSGLLERVFLGAVGRRKLNLAHPFPFPMWLCGEFRARSSEYSVQDTTISVSMLAVSRLFYP